MNIISFSGKHLFLSNFSRSPLLYKGYNFLTVEQAFQWTKCAEPEAKAKILKAATPAATKLIANAKTTKKIDNWHMVKYEVMRSLIRIKFKDPDLAKKLIATVPYDLIEGNTWGDTTWGVCRGEGKNWLGMLLMLERARLLLK